MPIFEYTCESCGHGFEALVRASTVPSCPKCQSTHLEKQLSVVGRVGGGAGTNDATPAYAGPPCGTCGNARGPGACSLN